MTNKRVVITGMGVIAPGGIGLDPFWRSVSSGTSKTRRVTAFDVSMFSSQVAAWVEGFDPSAFGLSAEMVQRMDRYVQFAVACTHMAVTDAGLDFSSLDRRHCGVVLANAICGTKYLEEEFLRITEHALSPINPNIARPDLYDAAMFNTPSTEISARYGLNGPSITVSTGCTAGTDSVGYAYELIKEGRQSLIISGASEAPLTPITFGAFDVLDVLSKINDEPEKASRPFDDKRNGFVASEGCGIVILEELGHALARGAHIYGEIIGYGTCNNAFHMTDLPPNGQAMADCIHLALSDAAVAPADIDYINAHGSSTRMNDIFETAAYKTVFQDAASRTPISSLKSMIGHPLAAANAIELVACGLVFKHDFIPPTINQEKPDPLCDLDYVANEGRPKFVRHILKTSSGFSGIHSSMVLRRWEDAL